jgi:hypothetical protein
VVTVLPPASSAVNVTVNAVPALGVELEGDTRNCEAAPTETLKAPLSVATSDPSVA